MSIAEQVVIEREVGVVVTGQSHTLWSIKFPIRDTNADMVALGGIELDITERKQTEMLAEDAEDTGETSSIEPLQRIHGAGRKLLGLIDEILDLSKIEAGKMELNPTVFDLRQLVESIVMTTIPLAARNRNQILGSYPDAMDRVRLDETRVRQVILNLVSNAVKFTEDGHITVSVREAVNEERDGVSVTVSDNGIGIGIERAVRSSTGRSVEPAHLRFPSGRGLGQDCPFPSGPEGRGTPYRCQYET